MKNKIISIRSRQKFAYNLRKKAIHKHKTKVKNLSRLMDKNLGIDE